VLSHIRQALRQLRHYPLFATTAVLTLGLGMGATTSMFSVVDALLLRPLPFSEGDRLIYIRQFSPEQCPRCYDMPTGNFLLLQRSLGDAIRVVAMRAWTPVYRGTDRTDVVRASRVTQNFFAVLGAETLLGRTFIPADTVAGARVLVISEAAWRDRLGADPAVLTRQLVLDGVPHSVIGVLRAGHTFPIRTEMWTTLRLDSAETSAHSARTQWRLDVFGRVADGVTLSNASVRVATVAARVATDYPEAMRGWRIALEPMSQWHNDLRPAILMALVAVGVLLVVACTNLAGLLLARLSGRERELALRSAMGASRIDIVSHVLTEAFLIAIAGAMFGGLVASWLVGVIRRGMPEDIASYQPGWERMHLSGLGIAVTFVTAIITAAIVGLGPAIRFSRPEALNALKEHFAGRALGRSGIRFRRSLVVAEIALSIVLLTCASLLVRSVANLTQAPIGVRSTGVLTMSLQVGRSPTDSVLRLGYYDAVAAYVAGLPGVDAAGTVSALPMNGAYNSGGFTVEGEPPVAVQRRPTARFQYATPGYIAAAGIPLLWGRSFTDDDRPPNPRVCLVNRTLARTYLGTLRPSGRALMIGAERCEIIGVVGDVFHNGPNDDAGAELYMPRAHSRGRAAELAIHTTGDPSQAAGAIVRALTTFDRNLAINRVRTMREIQSRFLSPYRVLLFVMLGFATIALLISAVGLHGIISYDVQRRLRDFGIRFALGAQAPDLFRSVLSQALKLAVVGAAIGLPVALLAARLVQFILYGVAVTDALTLGIIVVTLTGLTIAAAVVPALRAARLSPARVLNAE